MTHDAAIEALRRCAAALAGELSADERRRVVGLHDQALRLLSNPRHRKETLDLAERVAVLERQLADREPGERVRIVCTRLRISRRRFYELKRVHDQCGNFSALPDG